MLVLLGQGSPLLPAEAPISVDLTCYLRNYTDDTILTAGRVEVTIGPETGNAELKDRKFRFTKEVPADAVSSPVAITLDAAPSALLQRSIPLHRRASERRRVTRILHIYFVPLNAERNYRALDRATSLLETGRIERALALLEFAYQNAERPGEIRQYLVKLLYNYARALQNACIGESYGYATCDTARGLLVKLAEWYPANQALFAKESLTRQMITTARRDLDEYAEKERVQSLLSEFPPIEASFGKGGVAYRDAAEGLDHILASYDRNAEMWTRYGKPKGAVVRDAGLAWYRYAEYLTAHPDAGDPAQRQLAIGKAIERLLESHTLGRRDSDTALGLAVARGWLE